MNKYLRMTLYLLPFFINLIFILVLSHQIGPYFLSVGDSSLFISLQEAEKKLFNLWNPDNFGITYGLPIATVFFPRLIIYGLLFLFPLKWAQLIFFFILLNLIFYSSWYAFSLILKEIHTHKNILAAYIGAFFYTYNLYMIFAWTGFIDGIFVILLLAPFLVYLFIRLLSHPLSLRISLVLALIIGLLLYNPPFSFAVLLAYIVPFILLRLTTFSKKEVLYGLLTIGLTLITGVFFLYTLGFSFTLGDPFPQGDSGQSIIFPMHGISGIYRFFFDWTMNLINDDSIYHPFYPFFLHPVSLLSSYMLWILILISLIAGWKKIRNINVIIFLITSLLISIFIAKGNQSPFGFINEALYNIPFFGIFRTPASKFGLPFVLSLAILISISLSGIWKKKQLIYIFILFIFMQTFFFFSGRQILGIHTEKTDRNLIYLSKEYQDIIKLLNNSAKEGSVLFYPGFNFAHIKIFDFEYTGQDVLGKFIERPVIYEDGLILGLSDKHYDKIISSLDPSLVGDSSIRYIIIRKDINYQKYHLNKKPTHVRHVHNQLIINKAYKRIHTSPLFEVFELDSRYYKDLITLHADGKQIPAPSQSQNTYHYAINLSNQRIPKNAEINLIFRNSFHPHWTLKDENDQPIDTKHTIYNNYANVWKFTYDNEKRVDLYFTPQKHLFITSIISCTSIILLLLILWMLRKRKD